MPKITPDQKMYLKCAYNFVSLAITVYLLMCFVVAVFMGMYIMLQINLFVGILFIISFFVVLQRESCGVP